MNEGGREREREGERDCSGWGLYCEEGARCSAHMLLYITDIYECV